MNKGQNIKCDACGASGFVKNEETEFFECRYCGSQMHLNEQSVGRPVAGKQSKTKLSLIMISLPLVVILLMIVFWMAFVNMRVQTSVEQYQFGEEVQRKDIDPLAKPFMSDESESTNLSKAPQKEIIAWADKLTIKSQVRGQTSQGGLYWIFSVENVSDMNIYRPGVVVSLFDEQSKRLAEQSGWSALTELQPGKQTEVLVFLSEPPESFASLEINTLASGPNQFSSPPLPLEVKDFSVTEKNGTYELIGDVQNPNATAVKYSRIYAVARNSAGQPIGMGNAFATQKDLKAGETSGFKLRVMAFLQGQPEHWTLWAQGRKKN